jgi:hypothetical protein
VTEEPVTGALLAPPDGRRTRRKTMNYICLGYLEPGKFENMSETLARHFDFRKGVNDE